MTHSPARLVAVLEHESLLRLLLLEQLAPFVDGDTAGPQALQVVAPIVTLLVDDPAVHEMHPSVMELGAYLPLSHQTHSVRLKTYCPAEHIEQEVRSGLLNVPISHAVQSSILS